MMMMMVVVVVKMIFSYDGDDGLLL